MLDFWKRKATETRNSARWLGLVSCAQAFTAVCTGMVLGYLMMFVIVFGAAQAMASREDSEVRTSQPRGYVSYRSYRRERSRLAAREFAAAFNPDVASEEKPVEPRRVLVWSCASCILAVWMLILLATRYERRRLQTEGGWALGLAVGGRHLTQQNLPAERRLLNIVEELSIVFKSTPPAVLVLDGEPGINAFAAGLSQRDSILCVTSGAMEELPREELQAVIAHEFSHLTSGDTRQGTSLTAVLYGLVSVMSVAKYSFIAGRDSFDRENGNGTLGVFMMLAGAGVYPFGVVGSCSARVLAMAFNRSREKHADADAVDKTRNPNGLAKSLRRIDGHPQRGRIRHPQASIVAPMLFVDRCGTRGLFSTHPSVASRLNAVDPGGDHRPIYPESTGPIVKHESPQTMEVLGDLFSTQTADTFGSTVADPATVALTGGLAPIFESIAQPIVEFACLPGSTPIVLPLLLEISNDSLPRLDTRAQLSPVFDKLQPPQRYALLLALCDQTRKLTSSQRAEAIDIVESLEREIQPDDWFHHAWLWLLRNRLQPKRKDDGVDAFVGEYDVAWSTLIVLSTLCVCDSEGAMTDYEFLRGWSHLGFKEAKRVPSSELDWQVFETSLNEISNGKPAFRSRFLVAIANTVTGDSVVSPTEAVLLQVIRVVLGDHAQWITPTWEPATESPSRLAPQS